jgi:hypothetical protein
VLYGNEAERKLFQGSTAISCSSATVAGNRPEGTRPVARCCRIEARAAVACSRGRHETILSRLLQFAGDENGDRFIDARKSRLLTERQFDQLAPARNGFEGTG